jgi:acyl carrier protein
MSERFEVAMRDRMNSIIDNILKKRAIDRSIEADDDLVSIGLSSIDMVDLMLAVEAEFDLMIPSLDITPDNFRSIARIERTIARISPHLRNGR